MNLFRRIKNLYRLSEYEPTSWLTQSTDGGQISPIITIKKSFTTIANKPAIIIQDKPTDLFAPEQNEI